jgi:integrase
MSVANYLAEWVESNRKTVRSSTYRHYEGTVRRYLTPGLGKIRLSDLSPRDVQAFFAQASDEGQSARLIFHMRAVLRCALNEAMRLELVGRNVASLVRAPKVQFHQIEPFTVEEGRKLLEVVRATDLDAIVTIALVLGLRQGEILGLRWQDIDLSAKFIRVAGGLQRVEGKSQLLPPKTDRSSRVLPMPQVVEAALLRRKTEQESARKQAGPAWEETIPDLVFTTKWGWPMHASTVTHEFRALLKFAHLPRRTFHTMRHSAATFALSAGVDLKTVSMLLGHSQISLTANTYASVVPHLQKDATNKIEGLLKGGEQ